MPGRPTQADVARRAGASTAVVSTVINGKTDSRIRCSEATRERIWNAVRELGYVPNPVARKLVGAKNQFLGVFTYQQVFPADIGDFYHAFLVGVEEEAQSRDYDLMLFTRTRGGRRAVYQGGVNILQVADGAILLGGDENREELAALAAERFPFVYIGRRDIDGVSYVAGDYFTATAEIVTEFLAAGHRRIGYLRGARPHEIATEREDGIREGYRRARRRVDEKHIHRIDDTAEIPAILARARTNGVTAFIAESTSQATLLIEAAGELGLRIPDDLSVAALGDPLYERDAGLDITSFHIPRREMGSRAVSLLCEELTDPQPTPRRVVLPCTVIPGATLAPPRNRSNA